MDPVNLGIHLKKFNDRVKVMNQTGAKNLTLSAAEAQNVQSEIFDLLAVIADFASTTTTQPNDSAYPTQLDVSGGQF